jgi:poly-gamma-glutamate capsule biosynthesis protein CapA/YwtB (metallophosphatase superfamily)
MRRAIVVCVTGLLALGCAAAAPDRLVVIVGGDVHGESPIAEVLADGEDPLAAIAERLRAADVVIVNLETPVGAVHDPADKHFVFRADRALLERLAEAGVGVVNLANNHALDHGPDGLAETLAHAANLGLAVVGAGPDEDAAWEPAVLEAAGRTVAVLGMSEVIPDEGWIAGDGWGVASALDHDRAAEAVRAAAQVADHVVVSVHWGNEYDECPSVVQTELARRLLEAGADVVAGHHPHVVQGFEEREGGAVAYSLGNLLFYAATEETRDAVLLRSTFGAGGIAEHALEPVVIDDRGRPRPADAGTETGDRILERVRVRSRLGGTCPARVWDGLGS